jgi:pyridoxine 5-phosphate synthase
MLAIEAGADGITAHLREDRRHITDDDIGRLMRQISKPLNLEMAATDEMLHIAVHTRPHAACLVPEKRSERTTEGGLDVIAGHDRLKGVTAELVRCGIRVSLFIEPTIDGLDAAVSIGAPVVELHTGAWCDALAKQETARADHEFGRLRVAAAYAAECGLECHAGHGLDYQSARRIAELPQIVELNIGHFLVGDAIFIGFAATVEKMRRAMEEGREHAS